MTLAEAIFSFTRDDMRVEWLDAPGKGVFFHFARGGMRLYDPGKDSFLHFARGSMRFLTLANCCFCYLPGAV